MLCASQAQLSFLPPLKGEGQGGVKAMRQNLATLPPPLPSPLQGEGRSGQRCIGILGQKPGPQLDNPPIRLGKSSGLKP